MYKPYALSPCGHLACYNCIVSWFKAPPPEDRPALPPITFRKKTCPHCRAVVKDRPVQVWGVKSIVSNFAKSGLLQGSFLTPDESNQDAGTADPWDGIFHEISHSGHDNFGLGRGLGLLDEEDGGVFRCYDCLHEIWDGICSHCGREYLFNEDYDAFDDDDDALEWLGHNPLAWAGRLPSPDSDPDLPHGIIRVMSDDDEDHAEEEDDYEGSFIDDENDVARISPRRHGGSREVIELSSGSESQGPVWQLPSASRRRGARSSRQSPIGVSDDDEIQEIRRPTRLRPGRTGSGRGPLGAGSVVILSDDNEHSSGSAGPSRSRGAQRGTSTVARRNRTVVVSSDDDEHDSSDVDPSVTSVLSSFRVLRAFDSGLADRVAAQER